MRSKSRPRTPALQYDKLLPQRKRHFLAALFGGGYGIKLDLR
jgi:hypothetical protein